MEIEQIGLQTSMDKIIAKIKGWLFKKLTYMEKSYQFNILKYDFLTKINYSFFRNHYYTREYDL